MPPHHILTPSVWVSKHIRRAPPGARALDLACGAGRHTILLAQAGYQVLAVDRNHEALASLRSNCTQSGIATDGSTTVDVLHCDLEGETWPLTTDVYGFWDVIVVTHYLYRPFLDVLPTLLAPGATLVYETFSAGNACYGKPSNPDFLLRPGELSVFARRHGLQVVSFEEGYVEQPQPAMIQRLCAHGGLAA